MSERKIYNLKHHREVAGLMQTEMPYSQAAISLIESGKSRPRMNKVRFLAKYYGLSLRGFWESWEKSKDETEALSEESTK